MFLTVRNIQPDYYNPEDLIGIIATLGFVWSILGIIFHIFSSVGLYKIAKRKGKKHSWLAWIPVANNYLYGQIAFDNSVFKSVLLLILPIVSSLLMRPVTNNLSTLINTYIYTGSLSNNAITSIVSFAPFAIIIYFAYTIFWFIASYKIYKKLSTKSTAMIIFNILTLGCLHSIFLLAIRNNEFLDGTKENFD